MKKIQFKFNKSIIYIISMVIAIILIISLSIYSHNVKKECKTGTENRYNRAFNELINYVQNVEVYLAKAQISNDSKVSAENLTNVWREASNAQVCISQLPLTSSELGNTSKFLNQVSDYSYTLSKKNINGENLSSEELVNIKDLYSYSLNLENTLNQLSVDLNEGKVKWTEMTSTDVMTYSKQVSSISANSFSNLEKNLHEYSGLIYDGAYSEHYTSDAKKGLTGNEINEEKAKEIVYLFYGNENVKNIDSLEYSENANIPSFEINLTLQDNNSATISISKKGGHIIFANYNKYVDTELISFDDANNKGKEFLKKLGLNDMKETYYLKDNGILTINYAYTQRNSNGELITIYPDLIKVKVALDDGKILGYESTNYLNSHTERKIDNIKISKEDARKKINNDLEIESEGLAIIPTKWKTELMCWEFKGKINNNEFLTYVNVDTGKIEDMLLIVNTPNGILTH